VECGNKQCKNWIWLWYDYAFDTDNCRTQGRSYWIITLLLSLIPLPGFSSLYRGKISDGIFELLHGSFSYVLTLALNDTSRGRRVDDGLGECMIVFTLIMDVIKISHMHTFEAEAMTDLPIIICLTILAVIVNAICSDNRSRAVAVALALTAPTAMVKWIEHLKLTLDNAELDVNKCTLVSIF